MAAWLNVRMRSRPKPTTSQMKQIPRVLFCGIILICAQTLFADVVRTKDGSNLRGRIESINDGVLHLQTAYDMHGDGIGSLPVSERLADRVLSLPMNPYLSDEEVHRVCDRIVSFYK